MKFLRTLWKRIRWYPWRSKEDLVRWREGDWLPWKRSDWIRDWRGYRLRKPYE